MVTLKDKVESRLRNFEMALLNDLESENRKNNFKGFNLKVDRPNASESFDGK